MSKQYTCSTCSKELSNRHSLSRHKKKSCKGLVLQSRKSLHYPDLLPAANNDQASASFPDITNPANNPKLSAMIDVIVNNGEPSAAPKKIFQATPPRKLDYSKMIGPSSDAESPTSHIIPSAPRKKYPVKTMKKLIIPRKIDYSKMIGPSSDEESEPE